MARFRLILMLAALVAASFAPSAQALGTFGGVVTASTSGVVGVLTTVATANIGFLDNDPLDGTIGTNEALVLSIDGSATVKVGDIVLDPGTGLTGAAGSTVQSAPSGTLDFTVGATNVRDMLRFVDTLPTYANGGPDGLFNPGEPLFFDVDQTGTASTPDRLLVSGTGISGTVGGAVSATQSESTWAGAECVYQGTTTPTAVVVGMRRLTACGIYLAGSNVKTGNTDIGTVLTTLSGAVMSTRASRTVTDGVTTTTDQTVTSATAAFVAADVGSAITGTGIPTGAWITAINSGTSVEISAAATATATGVSLTINPTASRIITDGATTNADATVTAATSAFSENDVGRTVTGTGIPAGAIITEFNSATSVEISAAATATGAGVSLTLGANSAFLLVGQNAWIGSGTVTSGHYRITGTPATIVNCGSFGADADCAVATTTMSNVGVTMASLAYTWPTNGIKFFNANGNALATPDSDDRIVLDVDANSRVSPADVRLNTAGGQTFGARPTLAAASEVHGYLALAPTPVYMWLDTTTNTNQVDTTESIALSIDGDLVLDIGDICLTTVGSCSAGSQRTGSTTTPTTGGTWKNIATATNAGALGYLDANNNNKYDKGDSLYIHFGAALPSAAVAGDLLMASDTGGSGTRITTSPGTLKAFTPAAYGGLDNDGNGVFGVGDLLFAERAGGTAGISEPGDVRINSGTGVTGFGRNVQEGDAEAVSLLTDTGWATAALWSTRDLDNAPGFSLNDPVFLMPRNTGCPLVGSDVVLAQGTAAGITSGNFVGSYATTCTDLALGSEFAFAPAGAYSTASTWYVDMDGDGTVEVGDIRMAGISAGAAGTRVGGTSTTDQNTVLTPFTLGAADITYADASGDLVQAGLETIVLDQDGNLLFTPGDLVLSTGATTSSGTGTGGGGGATSTTTDTATSTSTDTATASQTSSSSSTTSTGATDLAAANLDLRASLAIDRKDGNNVLTWDTQAGVTGYQVWSSASPFELVATLQSQSSNTYTHQDADKDLVYLVTAYIETPLTAEQVNAGDVPGYSGVPEGQAVEDGGGKKGWIPGPGLAIVALALALAFLAARRRV